MYEGGIVGFVLNGTVALIQDGGFAMWPLVVGNVVLWGLLGWRAAVLAGLDDAERALDAARRGGTRGTLVARGARAAVEVAAGHPPHLDRHLDGALAPLRSEAGSAATFIRTLVAIAPLVGLLGTVTGMMETFGSLGDMALFAQSGGIAGGISQALLTTQMGLVVAVPGLVIGRVLDRRQVRVEDELDRVRELVLAGASRAA